MTDVFFVKGVRPYCWFAAVLLFMSYIIGLWFTLRTHAATIWNAEIDEKKAMQSMQAPNGSTTQPGLQASISSTKGQQGTVRDRESSERQPRNAIRDTQLYKRILSQSLRQEGLEIRSTEESRTSKASPSNTPHVVPPKSSDGELVAAAEQSQKPLKVDGLTEDQSDRLVRQVAEMAATAAAVAAQDATKTTPLRRVSTSRAGAQGRPPRHSISQPAPQQDDHDVGLAVEQAAGGHDAPNWGRTKSAVILLGATVLYAIIAEILVNTVDVVLQNVDIDEKFLGITLFALVPNTTEFLVRNKSVSINFR